MLLLFFTTIALASSPPLAPGAAARSLSFMTVGGAKLAIAQQMASNPHIDRACVQRLGSYALARPFETALEQQLTKAQLDNANKYYTTPLAKRYMEFRLQQLSGEMGSKINNPVSLTAVELNKVTEFGASDTGIALNRFNSKGNQKTSKVLLPEIDALFKQCWK